MVNPDEELRQREISVTHALEHYKNHCEFLGYSVEEDDESSIICNHQRKDTFRLLLLNHGVGVLAQIFYRLPERLANDPLSLYSYANELNYIFIFMKACIRGVEDGKPYIVLTSVLEGDYSRKNFAIFLENLDQDMDQFHSYPKTRDMWRTQDE
jgi:hypothetical protein